MRNAYSMLSKSRSNTIMVKTPMRTSFGNGISALGWDRPLESTRAQAVAREHREIDSARRRGRAEREMTSHPQLVAAMGMGGSSVDPFRAMPSLLPCER